MNDMSEPRLDFAPFVSREHGDVFAEIIFERLQDSEIIWEAFRATKLIGSPGEDHEAAVERYDRLAEEIRKLALAAAFVWAVRTRRTTA